MTAKPPAPRNQTIQLTAADQSRLSQRLVTLTEPADLSAITNKTIHQDLFTALPHLPSQFAHLAIIDPPYNLNKQFNSATFRATSDAEYSDWLDSWLRQLVRLLQPDASVYICGDWRTGAAIYTVASRYFHIQNRITFEREKGRGAQQNWKNCSEDIWFCTLSPDYHFNVDAVKLQRTVRAPYRTRDGAPKDWNDTPDGKYRTTHPSNLWTDITIPFWSMPENTQHPTQKPEKLIAKLILASSRPGDLVFDPFLGSGTTSVVAKKLGRQYIGIEQDHLYCCLAERRLENADSDSTIQGYADGVFWQRNTPTKQHH